jgi:hypothetical protein
MGEYREALTKALAMLATLDRRYRDDAGNRRVAKI